MLLFLDSSRFYALLFRRAFDLLLTHYSHILRITGGMIALKLDFLFIDSFICCVRGIPVIKANAYGLLVWIRMGKGRT